MTGNKMFAEKMLFLTDSISQLDSIIQKLDLLSEDFCYNYLEHIDFCSESEIKLIKTMAEVMRDYSGNAAQISAQLPDLSENILETIRSFRN